MTVEPSSPLQQIDRALDCLVPDDDPAAAGARLVQAIRPNGLDALVAALPTAQAAWVRARGFAARAGELLLLPGEDGVAGALLGLGPVSDADNDPWVFGGLAEGLAGEPGSAWCLSLPDDAAVAPAVLGFGLGAYRFTSFRAPTGPKPALLVAPPGSEAAQHEARAVWLARDLINLPANHLGPAELADAARRVLEPLGAAVRIVDGEALAQAYPAVHAVGAGSSRPPRVVRASWAGSGATDNSPSLALVGKGVVFDTGGYDLKPSAGMLRMKKDMGGAALMLALASLIMRRDLPVRLSLSLGCVENSVSGHAMRPSDILATRRGLSVEVGNTDAEGRLVLCDLLAEASDAKPDLLLDAATLTGAARTALGPDLPALFCNDDAVAESLLAAGRQTGDPLWRLPLWQGYADWLGSSVADLNNVSSRPMAGALTAALFLDRFIAPGVRWAHLDTYCWNDQARPGRPAGGEAIGLRAIFAASLRILNLDDDTKHSGNVIGTEPSQLNGL